MKQALFGGTLGGYIARAMCDYSTHYHDDEQSNKEGHDEKTITKQKKPRTLLKSSPTKDNERS